MPAEEPNPQTFGIQNPGQLQAALPFLINNSNVPKIYMQSFTNFASAIDISLVAMNIGTPAAVVTMTYSTAKSLRAALDGLLTNYEKAMGAPLLDSEKAQEKFMAAGGQPK